MARKPRISSSARLPHASRPRVRRSAFFKLGVSAQPNLAQDPDADPCDKEQCKDIWTDAKVDVTKIALSWWLSGALQAELDAQRCTKENRRTMRDLMRRLEWERGAG